MTVLRRIFFLFNRRRLERELEEEMMFHAEQSGCRFGDLTRWRERSIDEWGFRALTDLKQDIRYGVRSLRRQPLFAGSAFLLLALGVSANAAIFSLVRTALLDSMPVDDPGSLVQLGYHDPAENEFRPNHTHIGFEMFARDGRTVRDLFGFSSPLEVNATVGGIGEIASSVAATPNALGVLGVGGTLQPTTVLLTHGYWQRRFGSDPSVIGRTLALNSLPFTIAGVLPPGFEGMGLGEKADVFFPADRINEVLMRNARNPGNMWLRIMGRLQPGATIEQAQAEFEPVSHRAMEDLFSALPMSMRPQVQKVLGAFQFKVISAAAGAQSEFRDSIRTPLLVLLSSAGLLLLIACANIAGLSLARNIARHREFAIRVALGCGRGRLLRQMITENLLIAAAAGLAAWWFEPVARRALMAMITDASLFAAPESPPLAFLSALTVFAGLLVGTIPALRAWSGARLTEDRSARSPRIGPALIAAQVALSVVLLAGAAMFVETLRSYRSIDPGFRRDHLIAVGVSPGTLRYSEDQLRHYYRRALEALRYTPGVRSATLSRWPMGQLNWTTLAESAGVRDRTARNLAGPQFAVTTGLRVIAGRDITDADVRNRTAMVNEAYVERYFPDGNAVGRHVRFMDAPDVEFESSAS